MKIGHDEACERALDYITRGDVFVDALARDSTRKNAITDKMKLEAVTGFLDELLAQGYGRFSGVCPEVEDQARLMHQIIDRKVSRFVAEEAQRIQEEDQSDE